jgi:hypothetical protein
MYINARPSAQAERRRPISEPRIWMQATRCDADAVVGPRTTAPRHGHPGSRGTADAWRRFRAGSRPRLTNWWLATALCGGTCDQPVPLGTELTYKEYAKASEIWKRGFVFGISRYMSAFAQPDEEPPYPVRTAFQRCLGDPTDSVLVRHVECRSSSR